MEMTVLDLVKRSAAIPSMPQVATRFLEIIQDPDFDFCEVVELLSTDAGTASEVLRLANSSLFGVTRQVTTLNQAVTLLGIKRVRSLVLGRYIVDSINRKDGNNVDGSYYWKRSLTTAVLAMRLAGVVAPARQEEAFIAGLLADIGIVILDDVMPERYEPVAEQYGPSGTAVVSSTEQTLLGTTHAEVSALVLDHWQLPEMVCEAVRGHCQTPGPEQGQSLARVVWAADFLAWFLCGNATDLEGMIEHCRSVSQTLTIDPPDLAKCLEEIEGQIEELADLLGIEIVASSIHALAAAEIREQLVESVLPAT